VLDFDVIRTGHSQGRENMNYWTPRREGTAPAQIPGVASAELMQRVTRDEDYRRWTREFLGE